DRVGVKDIVSIIVERIINEVKGEEKYYLFAYPIVDENKKTEQQLIYVGYLEKLR
ncbi:DUF655 domain-containing protein, partial [Sulfolobus sp. B5]